MSVIIKDESDYVCGFDFPVENGKPTYKTKSGFSQEISEALTFKTKEDAEACAKKYCNNYNYFVFATKQLVIHTDDVIFNN